MSSIRLFILGSLAECGPMHGHQLRLLAEEEHVQLWTDITVGALYGGLKRLAAEGLVEDLRTEREGGYPERQVMGITEAGKRSLDELRAEGLRTIVIKPDPFDLAMTRLDPALLGELPGRITERLATLSAMLLEAESHALSARKYLTASEQFIMKHKAYRLRAEISWHHDLLTELPTIIADESARKEKS